MEVKLCSSLLIFKPYRTVSMIVSRLFEPPADALQIHSAFTRCRSVFTVSVIVSSPPGKPPGSGLQ